MTALATADQPVITSVNNQIKLIWNTSETVVLSWTFARADGLLLDVPTNASTVQILDATGAAVLNEAEPWVPDLSPFPPANRQTLVLALPPATLSVGTYRCTGIAVFAEGTNKSVETTITVTTQPS